MKVSNDKKIRLFMYIIGALMIACVTAAIITFLLQIPSQEIIYIVLVLIMITLAIVFMKLKTFIYEDSGEVISIKLYHPLENKHHCKTIEFPAKQLKDYGIKKTLQGYNVALIVESFKKKEIKREFYLTGFGRNQLNKLISSLEHKKKINVNNFIHY
ncbi:hypothetical protein [Epilithonimonas xixisoli]|uniref:PH (Pleckstrin Homology) domain-containing protein n=1 Tax=Epilithonimonas xixisoli TaxID=1476462 RepID=A0A4R8IJZ0_9FLAO|nr:hypothetical protein [Epilithonimonas xixisoli]TDX86939.1 hypothetical protein B0I22_1102 [Epilithonimonas xixisoli]